MDWLELKGTGLKALEHIAQQDGLRQGLMIVMPVPNEANQIEHERRCRNWTTRAIAHNGIIRIFPWYWPSIAQPEMREQVLQEIGEVLAEEIWHLIDEERFGEKLMRLIDAPYWLVRFANRKLPSGNRVVGRLEQFLYDRSVFERRAKKYARAKGAEYAKVIDGFFDELLGLYVLHALG